MRLGVLISGCDDSTWFVLDDVTDAQKELLALVAAKSVATSTCGCQPRMELYEGDKLESEEKYRSAE